METFYPISDEAIQELDSRRPLMFDIDERADGYILKKGWSLVLDGTQLFYAGRLIGEVVGLGFDDEKEASNELER